MNLYSHNNGPAKPIPPRIRMPDGSTRTDPETFTPEELAAAGYVGPLPDAPAHDPATHYAPQWDGAQWVTDAIPARAVAKATARDELLAGYVVQSEGFTLRATRDAQAAISQLVLLAIMAAPEAPMEIIDADGVVRSLTAQKLREIAGAYGSWVLAREMVLRG